MVLPLSEVLSTLFPLHIYFPWKTIGTLCVRFLSCCPRPAPPAPRPFLHIRQAHSQVIKLLSKLQSHCPTVWVGSIFRPLLLPSRPPRVPTVSSVLPSLAPLCCTRLPSRQSPAPQAHTWLRAFVLGEWQAFMDAFSLIPQGQVCERRGLLLWK